MAWPNHGFDHESWAMNLSFILLCSAHYDINLLVLFMLRVYAVCGKSNLILSIALSVTMARFGVNIWVCTQNDLLWTFYLTGSHLIDKCSRHRWGVYLKPRVHIWTVLEVLCAYPEYSCLHLVSLVEYSDIVTSTLSNRRNPWYYVKEVIIFFAKWPDVWLKYM